MSYVSRTDRRFQKVTVGLALENEFYNGRDNRLLSELYENPSTEKTSNTYRRFIASRDHREREAAFWLELGLSQDPTTFPDKVALLNRIRQMETIIYDILGRAGQNISQSLNDWLNYIANAGESISQGYWIDAKILMSRAVDASEETVSKTSLTDVKMRRELGILRSETRRDFEELLKASFRLRLPEKHLDDILAVQGLHLKILRQQAAEVTEMGMNLSRYLVERLATAERLLLQENSETSKARQEIEQALTYLEGQANGIQDGAAQRRVGEVREELRRILQEGLKTD